MTEMDKKPELACSALMTMLRKIPAKLRSGESDKSSIEYLLLLAFVVASIIVAS